MQGGPNQGASLAYTGRLQWNLLNDEDNPGYYTSGTYYGTAGDILAIAGGINHQKDGAGTKITPSDMTGLVVDGLFEKVLPDNMGVFTFNGEFKRFWGTNVAAFSDGTLAGSGLVTPGPSPTNQPTPSMFVFNGHSWTAYGLYLFPNKVWIGQFQPYARFVSISPLDSVNRQEWEGGVNYIIAGHNARISAFYRYGDISTKGFVGGPGVFAPGATGNKADSFHVALQLQY